MENPADVVEQALLLFRIKEDLGQVEGISHASVLSDPPLNSFRETTG